ncbi:Thymidylate kinase [Hondaea fermentalgiana]|uniref:Thymidylate kinase n=1 Tax=Hondaea fermentalgiana TaxID=2315210 RepID=A0A2R5GGP8_9STRA|nr:Thymidylate kinase [Hondaea fermentalgiana]|eukprot:GBG29775.1 Thymidylate kinase [Hondaea fermentalgiana]
MAVSGMTARGAFIVFEGVDRCGKTTQTQRLVAALQSRKVDVELCRFPDRTTATGKIIDSYLKNGVELDDHAVHLLFSANRWESAQAIRKKLAAGTTLIVDRYAHSGVCFSAAKQGMDIEWCKAPDAGLPAPDAVIFLKLAIADAMKRGQFGEERYEKQDFQTKVLDNFMQMKTDSWRVIDAKRPIDAIAEEIETLALDIINSCADKPLETLWK